MIKIKMKVKVTSKMTMRIFQITHKIYKYYLTAIKEKASIWLVENTKIIDLLNENNWHN